MKIPRTLFISDLHLSPHWPELTDAFHSFIQTQATTADALYILGDFFEVWVGDDHLEEHDIQIIRSLKALADKNVPVYFIHGNRDFLLGKRFAHLASMQILPDPTAIELYNKKILICHGDYLCIDDHTHQRFRRIYLNRLNQWLFTRLPKRIRVSIANKARSHSHQRHKTPKGYQGGIDYAYALAQLHEHHCDILVHGHTHKPIINTIEHASQSAQRVTLPAWENNPGYLQVTPNGMKIVSL